MMIPPGARTNLNHVSIQLGCIHFREFFMANEALTAFVRAASSFMH